MEGPLLVLEHPLRQLLLPEVGIVAEDWLQSFTVPEMHPVLGFYIHAGVDGISVRHRTPKLLRRQYCNVNRVNYPWCEHSVPVATTWAFIQRPHG